MRLRNLHTGLIVRVQFSWSSSTNTVTLNPRLLMYPHTRYRVEIRPSLYDRGGNRVTPTSWTFTTGS